MFESCDILGPIATCRNLSNEPRWSFFISRTLKYPDDAKGEPIHEILLRRNFFCFVLRVRGVWFLREIRRNRGMMSNSESFVDV